jgi:hypothetical protein
MTRASTLTSFALYGWTNPETFCDYPFVAVAEDRSVYLLLGNYGLSFEWRLTEEVEEWLAHDFARTQESLSADFATIRGICAIRSSAG